LRRIVGRYDLISLTLKNFMRQLTQHRLIFDEQNRFTWSTAWCFRFDLGRESHLIEGSRQVNSKGRSFSDFALNSDVPPALFDDSIDSRQAQARAFVSRLRRKERFKNAVSHCLFNPYP